MKRLPDHATWANTSRRRFLRAAALPLGISLLEGCGGGQDAVAASDGSKPSMPIPNSGSAGDKQAVDPASAETRPSPATPPAPTGPVPTWVANLPLWHWSEIPNTALASVAPAVRRLGGTGPSSKIDAWCGATIKRRGSVYMLGAAGGHGDYAGNEVNSLALNVERPMWVESCPSSVNADIINGTQFYLDNRPSATHTYFATQFIDELDRMIVFASPGINGQFPAAPANFPYVGDRRSYSFNVAAGDWDSPDYVAQYPGDGDFTAALCAKHPRTGDVYYSRNYGTGWYRWTRATNTWVRLSGATRAPWYAGAAIDPARDQMLVVGGYNPMAPQVHRLDGSALSVSFAGLGAAALTLPENPGVVFDEALDCFIVVRNEGDFISVLRVDASTWSVDKPTITGGIPAARRNGILNSVQYVPELKGIVIANSYHGNVWFMRTAA